MTPQEHQALYEGLPKFGQEVAVRCDNQAVTTTVFGACLSGWDKPWRQASFSDCYRPVLEWAELPAVGDPRWRGGRPAHTRLGDTFAVRYRNGHVSTRDYRTGSCPFPGIFGGEHRYWENVDGWMEVSELAWRPVPAAWLAQPTYHEWQRQKALKWIALRAPDVALGVINDGDIYRQWFQALVAGESVRWHKYKTAMRFYGTQETTAGHGVRRHDVLFSYVKEVVTRWRIANPQYLDEGDLAMPSHVIDRMFREAASIVLNHYYRSWKETHGQDQSR